MKRLVKRILKSLIFIILLSSLFTQTIPSQTTQKDTIQPEEANEKTIPFVFPLDYNNPTYPLTPEDLTLPSEPQLADTTPPFQATQEPHPRTSDPITLYVDDDNTQGPWDGTIEHPYRRIQDGLNAAHPGDTIYVFNGTYHEYFSIDLPDISLIGEEKHTTIIDGDQENFFVIWLNASRTHLSGFTIKNNSKSGWWFPALLIESDDNRISDNIFTKNVFGIGLRRWEFYTNERNIIEDNLFIANENGLGFYGGSNNTIRNNSFVSNLVNGLFAYYSYNNTIINNTITRNYIAYGAYYGNSNYDKIIGNSISWNSVGLRGTFLSAYLSQNIFDFHQKAAMSLWDLIECTLSENVFSGNTQGISWETSSPNSNIGNTITKNAFVRNIKTGLKAVLSHSSICDNIFVHNGEGIQLYLSDSTLITGNTLIENNIGFFVNNTEYENIENTIYYNNFIGNIQNAFDNKENNTWDNGTRGNYWSDYTGVDQDENGIGDTPYTISGGNNIDRYPMMKTCGALCASLEATSEALVNDPIQFLVFTWGGVSPYRWEWDFDDGNTSTEQNPQHAYTSAGTYTVTLQVTDNTSGQYLIFYPVTVKEIRADIHGPYHGLFIDPIQFTGSSSGGVSPTTWSWDFGDGGTSTNQNPVYTYSIYPAYNYWPMPMPVEVTVTDAIGNTDTDITWAIIEPKQSSPTIALKAPEKAFYINNQKVFPFFVTVVIRNVEISVDASDPCLFGVKFFIDDKLIGGAREPPYSVLWADKEFLKHKHVVRATAYDIFGNSASVEFVAWKFL